MQILDGIKIDFKDVQIMPQRSSKASRKEVQLERAFKVNNKTIAGIPIMAANMDTVGTFAMARSLAKNKMFTCLHKHYNVEELIKFFNKISPDERKYIFYTMGIKDRDIEKFSEVCEKSIINNICVDVANGYTDYFIDRVSRIREMKPCDILMAGNVVTREMTQELIQHGGVDIVKLGIGPGSVCETRKMTGVGYPQLSAIIECADAAHGLKALVCSDGGCKEPQDIAKAFGAGADFVMLGGMFAGADECEGEWNYEFERIEQRNGVTRVQNTEIKKSLKFYGMSSEYAMNKYHGGVADYRTSEGKLITVPYKGPVENIIKQICGGLVSTGTYIGADKIKDFCKRTTFVRIY